MQVVAPPVSFDSDRFEVVDNEVRLKAGFLSADAAGRALVADGFLTNVKVDAAAAIAKSKLAALAIVDADVDAAAAIAASKLGTIVTPTSKVDSGVSTSGTPGTVVADIVATAGKRLVGFHAIMTNAGATSDIVLTATLADDTTRTISSGGLSAQVWHVDENGGMRLDLAPTAITLSWSAAINQGIKSVVATTSGVGTSARVVVLSAIEVPA